MKKRGFLVCSAFFPFFFFGNLQGQNQRTIVLPQLEKTSQSSALGGGAAHLRGLNAIGVNPAGLQTTQKEILTHFQQLPLHTHVTQLRAASPLSAQKATWALGYLGYRSEKFDGRNRWGDHTGSFNHQDHLVGLHLSRAWKGPGFGSFFGGVSLKFIQSKIDSHTGRGWAVDVGARQQLFRVPLNVGFAVLNLGKGPSLLAKKGELPLEFVLAGAFQAKKFLTLLASAHHHPKNRRSDFSTGLEYQWGGLLALRGRFISSQGDGASSFGIHNVSAGLGVNISKHHSLDYAFQPFEEALQETGTLGSHMMTLTFRFRGEEEK